MAVNHLQTVAATPGPRLTILNKEVMANRVAMEVWDHGVLAILISAKLLVLKAAVMNKKSEATDHSKHLHLGALKFCLRNDLPSLIYCFSCGRFAVVQCPNEALARSNCIIVCPRDFPQDGQAALVKRAFPVTLRSVAILTNS